MRPYNDSVRKDVLPYIKKGNEYFDRVKGKMSDFPERDLQNASKQYRSAWNKLDDVYSKIEGKKEIAKDSKGQDVEMIRRSIQKRMSAIEKTLKKIESKKLRPQNPFPSSEQIWGYVSMVLLSFALISVSINLTGNAIASNPNLTNGIGVALFLSGLAFAFFYFRNKKKQEEKKKAKPNTKKKFSTHKNLKTKKF